MKQTGLMLSSKRNDAVDARRCRRRAKTTTMSRSKITASRADAKLSRDGRNVRDCGEPDPANVYPEHEDDHG